MLFVDQCPEQESNLQTLGFKPSRSAGWRIQASQQDVVGWCRGKDAIDRALPLAANVLRPETRRAIAS